MLGELTLTPFHSSEGRLPSASPLPQSGISGDEALEIALSALRDQVSEKVQPLPPEYDPLADSWTVRIVLPELLVEGKPIGITFHVAGSTGELIQVGSESQPVEETRQVQEVFNWACERHWLKKNRDNFPGEWVALSGHRLLAHGNDLHEVRRFARESGDVITLLAYIEPENQSPFGSWG